MTTPLEAELYIRFLLEQLSTRNEHHTFERVAFEVAKRRLSSNLRLATGPVSAGGDQGRDAESYYTRLPEELPGAGGFVGRAGTEPLVVACTTQRKSLRTKIRSDLASICAKGPAVSWVAFFLTADMPVAARHAAEEEADRKHGVRLHVVDGQELSNTLTDQDLVWLAEAHLGLPAHMVPDPPDERQPTWYEHTLAAMRTRQVRWYTPGAFAEVRDGLRHATFEPAARPDLPEWIGYIAEFVTEGRNPDLVSRARYERVVATLRGRDTLDGVEQDISLVLDHALTTASPGLLSDASVLLAYWGGAWLRHLASAPPETLRQANIALRARVAELLRETDARTHPVRRVQLLETAAHLCLQPDWPLLTRPDPGDLPSPLEVTRYREEGTTTEHLTIRDDTHLDVDQGMKHLAELVKILPRAHAFPVSTVSEVFQLLAPALTGDPRYVSVRDGLDAGVAAVRGDGALADRCRERAVAFRAAGRPLDALREFHEAKANWWHGDSLRGSLMAMRAIGAIYSELRLNTAAKQYALTAANLALQTGDAEFQDIVPDALMEAVHYSYVSGAWGDTLGLADIAIAAHAVYAEDAFDPEVHPGLERLDFELLYVLLAAERFQPGLVDDLVRVLGDDPYATGLVTDGLDAVRPAFTTPLAEFVEQTDDQLDGRVFSDLGPERTIGFAGLGTAWTVTCRNDRRTVLAAERFVAAAQVLLVELLPSDPVFLLERILVHVVVGTPLSAKGRVSIKPDNDALECSVVLSPSPEDGDDGDVLRAETLAALVYVLAHVTARPHDEFMNTVKTAFANDLIGKLVVARSYDDVAGLLDEDHYRTLGAMRAEPMSGADRVPLPARPLESPATPGPGYDPNVSRRHILENYEYLPTQFGHTLARVLQDPDCRGAIESLRADGWRDWHLLVAVVNVALNARADAMGALSDPRKASEAFERIRERPESEDDPTLPLALCNAESLRMAMRLAVLSVAQRRWRLFTAGPTPNTSALTDLLVRRYGFQDDVEHRDLLTRALGDDGLVRLVGP